MDLWRHLHPDLRSYTWLKHDGSLSSHIDLIGFPSIGFILCLPVLLFHVLSLMTMPFFSASLSLNLFLVALADGNWDPVFLQTVSDFWPRQRSRKPSFSSLQDWWDRGKEHIKGLAVHHCSGAHNERSLSRSVLSALACQLKGRINDRVVSEGARVRSRVKWAEECETSVASC